MYVRALKNLGFIKRTCDEFIDTKCPVTLYVALDRSIFELDYMVLNPK